MDDKTMARLYALATKRTEKKRGKARAKDAADKAAGRPRKLREDLSSNAMTDENFKKRLIKKYGDSLDVLGTAKSYTDRVKDMRKKSRF